MTLFSEQGRAIASVIEIRELSDSHLGGTPSAHRLTQSWAITDWEICGYEWISVVMCQSQCPMQWINPTQYLHAIALP